MKGVAIAASLAVVLSAAPVFAQAAGQAPRPAAPAPAPPAAAQPAPAPAPPPPPPFPAGAKIGFVNLQQVANLSGEGKISTGKVQALMAKKTQFATAVTEKLLTYSLGRGLEFYDAPAVRAIDRSAAADGYRWSSMMLAIVKSTPFQMRTAGQR